MPTIEVEARLDLIHLANQVLGGLENAFESHEISGLVEALCRHRDLDVETCLSEPREEILVREAPDLFADWQAKHANPLGD